MDFTEVDENVRSLNALMSYVTYFPCSVVPYDAHNLKIKSSKSLLIEFMNGCLQPHKLVPKCHYSIIVIKGDGTFKFARLNLQQASTQKLVVQNLYISIDNINEGELKSLKIINSFVKATNFLFTKKIKLLECNPEQIQMASECINNEKCSFIINSPNVSSKFRTTISSALFKSRYSTCKISKNLSRVHKH